MIFQGDIFEPFKNFQSWLGYATEKISIGEDKDFNYFWFESCFGKAAADNFADKKIICCGTVIGAINEMKNFCRIMWETLKGETTWGHEQAIMNYLVHKNLLPIENLLEIDIDGEIFTMALADVYSIENEKILRGGRIPAVVHQYDRYDELINFVDEIYRAKDFQAVESYNDLKSELEQAGCLLQVNKIKDATQLFLNKFFYSDDFKDRAYALIRIWELTAKKTFTSACEILELAVQNALLSVRKFSTNQLVRIHRVLIQSEKNYHIVDFEFKKLFANRLLEIAEEYLRNNDVNNCFIFLDFIDRLEMPADKNYYLFVAKANRTFGRKDEALESYKKALCLS